MRVKILVIAISIISAIAWHSSGHMMTALIAQIEIKKIDPTLIEYLEKVLNVIGSYTNNKNYAFIESAVFSDDIKALGWNAFNEWHYKDNYIYTEDAPD